MNKKSSDLEGIYDLTDIPRELLRDPTYWLDAAKVEEFLKNIDEAYGNGENLMESLGHRCFEFKAWGVLDSVLRMMQDPHDIFAQPQRFISYFISPAPPLAQIRRDQDAIFFELPISSDEYPYVTAYLRAALEALPTFMRKDMANVTWDGTRIEVTWTQKQDSFFVKDEVETKMDPEFMQNLIGTLESVEKELQESKKKLRLKDEELAALRTQIELNFVKPISSDAGAPDLRAEVLRLSDYMTRAKQLITLLVGQDRMNSQVRSAMKRVNWEVVSEQFPQTVARLLGAEVERAEEAPRRKATQEQIEFDS